MKKIDYKYLKEIGKINIVLINSSSGEVINTKYKVGEKIEEDMLFFGLKKGDFWLIDKKGDKIGCSMKRIFFKENKPLAFISI